MARARLNLDLDGGVKHWFSVACSLRSRKMTAVIEELMRAYAREALVEHKLPDPFAPSTPPKPRAKPGKHR